MSPRLRPRLCSSAEVLEWRGAGQWCWSRGIRSRRGGVLPRLACRSGWGVAEAGGAGVGAAGRGAGWGPGGGGWVLRGGGTGADREAGTQGCAGGGHGGCLLRVVTAGLSLGWLRISSCNGAWERAPGVTVRDRY